jgi:hypothetical protein
VWGCASTHVWYSHPCSEEERERDQTDMMTHCICMSVGCVLDLNWYILS